MHSLMQKFGYGKSWTTLHCAPLHIFPLIRGNNKYVLLIRWGIAWLMCSGKIRHGKTGESGQVNRVAGQNGSFLNGSIELRVKRVAGWVGSSWPVFFKQFFFFEIDAICQLFMSSLTVIRFSLVILLPITTKHLTWYPNLVQLLFQLSRN